MTIQKFVLSASVFFTFTLPAFALPHHFAIRSDEANENSVCVFPDGTSPSKRPEIHCYDPTRFLKAYGIDKLHERGITGKGQTVVLVDSYGSPTIQNDLDHFSDAFGLPRAKVEFVYPNGVYVNPLSSADQVGWAEETTLDVEWAHAVAPDAKLVSVVTSSDETTGMAGMEDLFKGVQMAAEKYPGAVISMSFGTGESTFTADEAEKYLRGSFHKILADAVAGGATILASAGDSGSVELNLSQSSYGSAPDAGYPATDPLITAVGGTALETGWIWTPEGTADDFWKCQLDKNENCPSDFLKSVDAPESRIETVWKEDWAVAAGGGGVSSIFDTPDFQRNLNPAIQKISQGHRTIPDVSLNAAVNGGVDVYTSYVAPKLGVTGPAWQSVGGTSCASPETAGLIALAAQQASDMLDRKVGIGSLNNLLYTLPSRDFNDIVSQTFGAKGQVVIDNNALYFNSSVLAATGPTRIPPIAVPGFFTLQGYDMATGLGSPKAESFVLDLAQSRVQSEPAQQLN